MADQDCRREGEGKDKVEVFVCFEGGKIGGWFVAQNREEQEDIEEQMKGSGRK